MILPETAEERRPLTKSFPVLLSSMPGGGKSSASEFLTPEEKKRTVILNFDAKELPEDEESDYFLVKHFTNDDPKLDMFSALGSIRKAIANKNVDRIIIDTFSGYYKDLWLLCKKKYTGWDVSNNYNANIAEFLNLIKTETATHCKFVYVYAHYKPIKKDLGEKKTVVTKGNEWYAMVESEFNTVIEAVVENGKFYFMADNGDEFTSTRVRRSMNPLQTEENSLAELEEILVGPVPTEPTAA